MAFAFNPITGKLDLVGSGGGGGNPFDQSLNTTDDVQFNSAVISSHLYSLGSLRVSSTDTGGDTFVLERVQETSANGNAFRIDHGWNNLGGGTPKALVVNVTGQAASSNATLFEANFGGARKFAVDKDGTLITGVIPDARLSSNVSLDNTNNNFTAGQSITAAANTSALTASYSVTGANTTPLLDLSGTWNTSGVVRGIRLNITDTASNGSSLLFDLQTGGTSRFAIRKDGAISVAGQFAASFSYYNGAVIAAPLKVQNAAAQQATLEIDAANILAQRNGTNAQSWRLFNSWTDASNSEFLSIDWTTTANTATIGTKNLGTGTARSLTIKGALSTNIDCGASGTTNLQTAGTTRVLIGASTAVCSVTWRISSGSNLRLEGSVTPASPTATGTTGDIQRDADYIYVCTATNTWKRAALSTW
jgi:hypothetical protein